MIFCFPFRVEKKKWRKHEARTGAFVCILWQDFPQCQPMQSLYSSRRDSAQASWFYLPHYKRQQRPDLFLSSRIPGGRLRHHFWLWGKCVAFISINGSTSHRKNPLWVFKCLNDDLHKAGRAFLISAAMPTVAALGLGSTVGCPLRPSSI